MNSMYIQKVKVGRYRVHEGDNAKNIAVKLYGDVHKSSKILVANPAGWEPGDIIDIPGFSGVEVYVGQGEQFTRLFKRSHGNAVPAKAAKESFFRWNGRQELQKGEIVFFVDLMRKSHGY